jgi:hypothetical protein
VASNNVLHNIENWHVFHNIIKQCAFVHATMGYIPWLYHQGPHEITHNNIMFSDHLWLDVAIIFVV